ncbi:MAG TPA: nucleotide disphospho-sugar-binding domain-containing protein [Micromonosporaceae bacterium]
MRVLFVAWAWPSHVHALVPLAKACRAAGHEVRLVTQPAMVSTAAATGLPVAPVGADVDAVSAIRGYVSRAKALAAAGAGAVPAGPPRALALLTELADAMVDDLVTQVRQWPADLVVYEATTMAGPIAAAAAGVPAIRHLYGIDLLWPAREALAQALAPVAARYAVVDLDPIGLITIDPCPPGLQGPVGYQAQRMRHVPYLGGFTARPDRQPPGRRPRVCVTWGTTLDRLDPALFAPAAVVSALADAEVEVVVAIADYQRALLGAVPPGTVVHESAPLAAILPECDAVISHGGAATMLNALHHGLPMLLLPRLPDHAGHARRVQAAGAGVVLPAAEATAKDIRRHAEALVTQSRFRAAAEALQRQMQAAPSPATVAASLDALVTRGHRQGVPVKRIESIA